MGSCRMPLEESARLWSIDVIVMEEPISARAARVQKELPVTESLRPFLVGARAVGAETLRGVRVGDFEQTESPDAA